MLKAIRKVAVVGLVTAAAGVALTTPVEAGTTAPELTVHFSIHAANADQVLAGISVEVYTDTTPPVQIASPGCVEGAATADVVDASRIDDCDNLAPGDYVLGLTGVPDNLELNVFCVSDEPPALLPQAVLEPSEGVYPYFSTEFGPAECSVSIWSTIVAVDKVVEGGPDTPPTFPVSVVQDATELAAGADPAPNTFCDADLADCVLLDVTPDFQSQSPVALLETTPLPQGYELVDIVCDYFIGDLTTTLDGTGISDVNGDGSDLGFDGDIYCVVTNQWIGGTLDVDVAVVNDDGGTGTPADITIEIYDSTDTLISSHPCAADGNCVIAGLLPPGDYTIGYTGLPTYTCSWTQTVTPPMILTAVDAQAIITDDPDAEFTIVSGGAVQVNGVCDDPPPATTTTTTTTTTTIVPVTTTTTTTTTTIVPVTTTTTTIAIPIAPTLPETGASADANARIALIAVGLIAAGGALVIAVSRRRTA